LGGAAVAASVGRRLSLFDQIRGSTSCSSWGGAAAAAVPCLP